MRALDVPYPPSPSRLAAGTPHALLLALLGVLAAAPALAVAVDAPGLARVLIVTTLQAALLATAIGWAAHDARWDARWLQAAIVALLAVAGAASLVERRGGFLYLVVGGALVAAGTRGRLEPLGVRGVSVVWIVLGVGVGAVLGGHLLIAASRTVSFHVRDDGAIVYLAALAYDLGANVPAAEGFFRGALFNRLQRRGSFATAAAISSAACVIRYVIDPQLPSAVDTVAGAVFYILVLSIANAWLLWRTGSLLPGVGAAVTFFAAWRLLARP